MTTSISIDHLNPDECLDWALQQVHASVKAYTTDPTENYFTRSRKLPFEKLIRFLMSLGGKTINSELCEYFTKGEQLPTDSALCQQRNKLDPSAIKRVMYLFNQTQSNLKILNSRRILAFDGSAVNIPFNPGDKFTLARNGDLTYSQLHLNALYDTLNDTFIDFILTSPSKTSEVKSLIEIIKTGNYPDRSVFIEDRGICSYDLIATMNEMNKEYIIRSKDIDSGTGILKNLPLPSEGEFDEDITITLTRKQNKEVRENPQKYKYLHWGVNFPFMPPGGEDMYELSFRVIRLEAEPGKWITIITNMGRDEFPAEAFRELYHLRWREETAFLKLKYPIGMLEFHSKNTMKIEQEINASILFYNYCAAWIYETEIQEEEADKENKGILKYQQKKNFSLAVTNCRLFIKKIIDSDELKNRIKKFLIPIRPGRKAPRYLRRQTAHSQRQKIA